MPIAQPVYNALFDEIKSLPEDYTVEIFNFVGYLKEKAARQSECPICTKLRDPETGESLYNNEIKKGIKEVDDMLAGKKPNTLKSFNSLKEMITDLDSDN
ncbi:MAG: hypothetical protein FWH35_07880 [Treponema sp.]|nr:hypothetical protein [Treponema sp.]